MVNSNKLDMDNTQHKLIVGHVIRKLVKVGIDRFVESWNNHRIPCKGIPAV